MHLYTKIKDATTRIANESERICVSRYYVGWETPTGSDGGVLLCGQYRVTSFRMVCSLTHEHRIIKMRRTENRHRCFTLMKGVEVAGWTLSVGDVRLVTRSFQSFLGEYGEYSRDL
jgi:hypothetical protein